MPAPYNNLRSKLDRSIAAYLVAQGCGSVDDVLPNSGRKPKGYPCTIVRSAFSKPEVPMTGIRRITVHITVKGSAVQERDEPNDEQSIVDFRARVAQTNDALMQSDDDETFRATAAGITLAGQGLATPVDATPKAVLFAQNNADMVDFTCQGWYDAGEGDSEASAQGTALEEILIFEAICSAIDLGVPPLQWTMLGEQWAWDRANNVYYTLGDDGLWHQVTVQADGIFVNPQGVPFPTE